MPRRNSDRAGPRRASARSPKRPTCPAARRTQYFPTVDQILLDATLGLLSQMPVDNAIAQADPGGDASGRVSAMIRALTDLSSQTMPLGRSLIRLTVDAPAGSAGQPKRGYRRINWIEHAIEPVRDNLDDSGSNASYPLSRWSTRLSPVHSRAH
jgi:hypothetical protein